MPKLWDTFAGLLKSENERESPKYLKRLVEKVLFKTELISASIIEDGPK